MNFGILSRGSIEIDGVIYTKDVVIDGGAVRKRKKKSSKAYKKRYGHTPLSTDEEIPWMCNVLIIGTGHEESMIVMDEVREEAERRGVELRIMNTRDAVEALKREEDANAILHLTC
jgi:hypothetical protein